MATRARWWHVRASPRVNKQHQGVALWLSGHTRRARSDPAGHTAAMGAAEDASGRIVAVPQEGTVFFNIEHTRLAPLSGMRAWFLYALRMVGRRCDVYVCICMCVCMYIYTYVAPEEESLST